LLLARARVRCTSAHRRPPLIDRLTRTNLLSCAALTRQLAPCTGPHVHGPVVGGCSRAAAPCLQASARAYLPRHGRYVHRCLDAPHRCQNDLYMSTTGRRILTAKTMALAVMAIVFAVGCHLASSSPGRRDRGTPQPLPPRQAQLVGAALGPKKRTPSEGTRQRVGRPATDSGTSNDTFRGIGSGGTDLGKQQSVSICCGWRRAFASGSSCRIRDRPSTAAVAVCDMPSYSAGRRRQQRRLVLVVTGSRSREFRRHRRPSGRAHEPCVFCRSPRTVSMTPRSRSSDSRTGPSWSPRAWMIRARTGPNRATADRCARFPAAVSWMR